VNRDSLAFHFTALGLNSMATLKIRIPLKILLAAALLISGDWAWAIDL
jgi:hypothetical protein